MCLYFSFYYNHVPTSTVRLSKNLAVKLFVSISLLDQFATLKTRGKLGRITLQSLLGLLLGTGEKIGQYLTGPSPVLIPLTIAVVADE